MDREQHLERIERGATASVTQAVLQEPVKEAEERILNNLTNRWRAGTLTHETTYGLIGGLAALRELMTHLEYEQRQGNISAEKEFNSAQEQ